MSTGMSTGPDSSVLSTAARADERSLNSLVGAGRELVGRAPSAAVELFRRAIELSEDPSSARASLLPELAEALVSAGLLEEGEAASREAIERRLDDATETRFRLNLVMLLSRRPRTGAALKEAEAARHSGWRIWLESPREEMKQPQPSGERNARTTVDRHDS